MMTPEQRSNLVLQRIQQAEKTVEQVEFCLANDQLEIAANRIYYGMFYAMLALGLLKDFETSKHQQMIGWFNKNFVFTGIFPKQFTRLIKDAFDARTNSDYKVNETPTVPQIEAMLADMKIFIASIKDYLETQLQAE
jgi:uncharacterized protein (UPF0332 family)